jgi:hypothetical protein
VASTLLYIQKPDFFDIATQPLGTACASPASSVEDPDIDEVNRQISIATGNNASKSSAGSDHGHTLPLLSPASCNVKTEAASPLLSPAQNAPSPSQGPGGFQCSRRAMQRVMYYSGESDSSMGIDCARSQDIDEYSLAASAEGVEVDVLDEDEVEWPLRKRCKLPMPSTRETGLGAARVK